MVRLQIEAEELPHYRLPDPVVCRSCSAIRTFHFSRFCIVCRVDVERNRARTDRVRGQHYGTWSDGRSNVPPTVPNPSPFDEEERAAIADALQKDDDR